MDKQHAIQGAQGAEIHGPILAAQEPAGRKALSGRNV
jgi:hypothetical protein